MDLGFHGLIISGHAWKLTCWLCLNIGSAEMFVGFVFLCSGLKLLVLLLLLLQQIRAFPKQKEKQKKKKK